MITPPDFAIPGKPGIRYYDALAVLPANAPGKRQTVLPVLFGWLICEEDDDHTRRRYS
ncbi:hypothetical protein ACH5Y9_03125 [Methylomonas sp. BW4-1]|uniref:hypothetical protein n=1 Tax=Methylomonas sp. BW4-1 TaxID=3376685 RepID=UPI0040416835